MNTVSSTDATPRTQIYFWAWPAGCGISSAEARLF